MTLGFAGLLAFVKSNVMKIRPKKLLCETLNAWGDRTENVKHVRVGMLQINLLHSSSLIVFDILFRQEKKLTTFHGLKNNL